MAVDVVVRLSTGAPNCWRTSGTMNGKSMRHSAEPDFFSCTRGAQRGQISLGQQGRSEVPAPCVIAVRRQPLDAGLSGSRRRVRRLIQPRRLRAYLATDPARGWDRQGIGPFRHGLARLPPTLGSQNCQHITAASLCDGVTQPPRTAVNTMGRHPNKRYRCL
jgi:hypothetical protein